MSCDSCILPKGEVCPVKKIREMTGQSMGNWKERVKPTVNETNVHNIVAEYEGRVRAKNILVTLFKEGCPYQITI